MMQMKPIDENERIPRIIETTRRVAGRTLTTDEARELARIADASVRRERF